MIQRALIALCLGTWLTSLAVAGEYQGFEDKYEVQRGDLNGDGRLDLHLTYKPDVALIPFDDLIIPIASPPTVNDFVLQQNTSGGFDLINSLTSGQLSAVKSWQSVLVRVILGDVNVDGFLDIILRDVAGAIPGAQDVLIFAPSGEGASPPVVRSMDAAFNLFFRDVGGWIENPAHFDSGWFYACFYGFIYVPVAHYDPYEDRIYYTYEWRLVQVCGWFFDATGFSIPAINFLNSLIGPMESGALTPLSGAAVQMSQQLQQLLGVPFMRGTLESGAANFGLPGALLAALTDPDRPDLLSTFLDRYRLFKMWFQTIRKMVTDIVCGPPGAPHFYEVQNTVCPAGASGCNPSNVYERELLVHPVVGYWDRKTPVQDGEDGYAEMGCTRHIKGACDPVDRALGFHIHGIGVFDGGPIWFDVDTPNLHLTNHTKPGHVFHSGEIQRWSLPASGGGVKIRTVGTGTGQCPLLNEIGGRYMFNTLDKFIECHLASGCGLAH